MKTKRTLIVAVSLVCLLLAGAAFSQCGFRGLMKGNGNANIDRPDREDARRDRFERHLERLAEFVGLSEEQMQEYEAIFTEHHESQKELRDQLRDAMKTLREEMAKDDPDEELLEQYIAAIKSLRDQMRVNAEALRTKIEEFVSSLTTEQQAKFILFHAARRARGPMGRHREMPPEDSPIDIG
ncbi:Spy/CpxP family protein refolding chaperone [bacterium]|nr:Spy/CpxP family protein refolding chaperone [bacterium]